MDDENAEDEEGQLLPEEPLLLAITDTLDLHSFLPQEVRAVVTDYLEAASAEGFERLLIVHGRGAGVQRQAVRALLERHPRVAAYGDVAERAGGATWVQLFSPSLP
jgi:DNA-nicking Smr family endonuclease